MSKYSKDAFNLTQDIYSIGGDLEKLEADFNEFKITPEAYANNLYIFACKISYLKGVIDAMRQQGYMFSNYEKELTLLDSISDHVDNRFKISNMGDFEEEDLASLLELADKYEHILPLDEDIDEDDLSV